MGEFQDHIPSNLIEWILNQHMFWVATAPLSPDGHINISPKGVEGTFHAVHKNQVWYEDLTGSGIETVSHLRQNGRITILFSAFDGPARIVRLFGTGQVHEFGTEEYEKFLPAEQRQPGSRAVIIIDVHKVGTSCGWAIPFYQFVSHRPTLNNFNGMLEKKSEEGNLERNMRVSWKKWNLTSQDGLSGLLSAFESPKALKSIWKGVDLGDIKKTKAARRGFVSPGEGEIGKAETGNAFHVRSTTVLWDDRLLMGIMIGVALSTAVQYLRVSLLA